MDDFVKQQTTDEFLKETFYLTHHKLLVWWLVAKSGEVVKVGFGRIEKQSLIKLRQVSSLRR